jgi:hypothetical protein
MSKVDIIKFVVGREVNVEVIISIVDSCLDDESDEDKVSLALGIISVLVVSVTLTKGVLL